MKPVLNIVSVLLVLLLSLGACSKVGELDMEMQALEERIEALEQVATDANGNAIALKKLYSEKITIVGMNEEENGYLLSLSDGTEVRIVLGTEENAIVPVIGIDADGRWIMSLDGGLTFKPVAGADSARQSDGKTPDIRVDAEGFWQISLDGGQSWKPILDKDGQPAGSQGRGASSFFKNLELDQAAGLVRIELMDGKILEIPYFDGFVLDITDLPLEPKIYLGQTLSFGVRTAGIVEAMLQVPEAWTASLDAETFQVTAPASGKAGEYDIVVLAVSEKGLLKKFTFTFTLIDKAIDTSDCKVWNDFVAGNADNVLLDYSYAGYMHGEIAPPEAAALGYTVYNVMDYGAIPNDGKSDREAFLKCVAAAIGTPEGQPGYEISKNTNLIFNHKEKANAIVYFPEGEFILHSADDDTPREGALPVSHCIQIRSGNFVMRGAGRDKTSIIMQDLNYPSNPDVLYSSPLMLDFKHNSWISSYPVKSMVTGAAAKGTYSVEVSSTAGMAVGDWICINVKNNDPAFVAEELAPYTVTDRMTDIKNEGVKVNDFHQIKSISGKTVTFHEPIMRAIDPKYGWEVMKWPHYENVGIEDLTFVGNAKDNFDHHASWQDDGAFKPVGLTRLANSWIRRVRFTSVSEACTIAMCANVSAYDIEIDGRRGHSSVRSAGSSRVFIGAVNDHSSGKRFIKEGQLGEQMANAGQYHAVGVSKPSMGAVLWRNVWGDDSCFESHASQPRATLIDCCRGGWMRWRQGGADSQVPNHLNDLTLWNLEATTAYSGEFIWWDAASLWWKFVMPIVVGFHGEACTFDASQMLLESSTGIPVNPESLYEAQLKKRLGAVPAWLIELKNK